MDKRNLIPLLKENGNGISTWKDGASELGYYQNGSLAGKGILIMPNKRKYFGNYLKGKKQDKNAVF